MQIVHYPDPSLKRRAEPLPEVTEAVRARIREMFALMYQEKGVGLAAPQVGWSTRLFVVNTNGDADPSGEKVYVNPEIIGLPAPAEEVADEEGCLSIPGIRGKVLRHRRITVRALGLDGQPFQADLADLGARVFQHELDHLDGILFITRLSTTERMLAGKTLKKLEKEYKEKSDKARDVRAR